ncbi:MAG TPA: glycosyltransferase [Candidatus Angelobacter sp.]|nr:glycosyltransferase [Candidatus Angelobacter sp.]
MSRQWHIVTCEFPPQIGGVGDYSFEIAKELARFGDEVHVWCGSASGEAPECTGVSVHRMMGGFSPRDLWRAGKLMDEFPAPRRLFVQWVPHGYGYRSMNVFFCVWLWLRAKMKRDHAEIMFHEVWLSFGISWKANIAAAVHRVMVALLKDAAAKIWISCEAWREFLQNAKAPAGWLPVSCNVSGDAEPEKIAAVRQRCREGKASRIVGHLGIGDSLVEGQLRQLVPSLLQEKNDVCFLLIGKRSLALSRELQSAYPDMASRILCSGVLSRDELSAHVSACDLLVQPYIDGISTRRTAAMAALATGRALLTTSGHSTEPFWLECGQLAIVPSGDTRSLVTRAVQLLEDDHQRERMANAGKQLYYALFAASVSVQVLREEKRPWNAETIAHLTSATHSAVT